MGPAGLDDTTAVRSVLEHYRALGRPPIAAVEPRSPEEELFRAHGWGPESEEADALFLIAGVAAARRRLPSRPAYAVSIDEDGRQATAQIGDGASGVAALAEDWLGLRTIEVAPHRRRRGLGLALVAALLDWGAEHGTTTAYLQVISDNTAAMALYEQLGFATHHAYRYLAPPP
jgi:ribosomal protein S18 acetylase RimI-like enzyme